MSTQQPDRQVPPAGRSVFKGQLPYQGTVGATPEAASLTPDKIRRILSLPTLTPLEKQNLQAKLDQLEGRAPAADPIAEEARQIAAGLAAEGRAAGLKPPEPPPAANIGELRADKQQEIRNMIRDAMSGGPVPPAGGEVAAQYVSEKNLAERLTPVPQAAPALPRSAVFDDLMPPAPAPAPAEPAQEEAVAGGVSENQPKEPPHHCRFCGADPNREAPEVGRFDLQAFVAHLLSPPDNPTRFKKEYRLFGDRVGVTFRSTTPAEEEAILIQVDHDARVLKMGLGESSRRFADYRLVARLAVLEKVGSPATVLKTLAERLNGWKAEDGNPTPLPALLRHVGDQLFVSEVLRIGIGRAYGEFSELLGHLESQANNENFWEAVGT